MEMSLKSGSRSAEVKITNDVRLYHGSSRPAKSFYPVFYAFNSSEREEAGDFSDGLGRGGL